MSKTEYRCIKCGSPQIYWDAYAAWDSDNQTMSLVGTFDHAKCADCGNAGTIEDSKIVEVGKPTL